MINKMNVSVVIDNMPLKVMEEIESFLNSKKCRYKKIIQFSDEWKTDDLIFISSKAGASEACKEKNELAVIWVCEHDETVDDVFNASRIYGKAKGKSLEAPRYDNYIKVSAGEIKQLSSYFDFLKEKNEVHKKNNILSNIIHNYIGDLTFFYRSISQEMLNPNLLSDQPLKLMLGFLKIYQLIKSLKESVIDYDNPLDLSIFLNQKMKKNGFDFKLSVLSIEELMDMGQESWCDVYPVIGRIDTFFRVEFLNTDRQGAEKNIAILLSRMFINLVQKMDEKNQTVLINEVFERALSLVDYPVVVFAQNNELLLHNQKFSQMSILPTLCLRCKNEEKIEHNGIFYKVFRKDIHLESETYFYFMFMTDKELGEKTDKDFSSSELGIISSSIAHELNNPLAGILAAIQVLDMDNEEDQETKVAFANMSESAKRSKELVEIFLGFSKKDPRYYKQGDLRTAFVQATHLLRFRMIESGVRLDFKILDVSENVGKDSNVSVMAMIFYIILSEIITMASKFQLLNSGRDKPGEEVVSGILRKDINSLRIRLDRKYSEMIQLHKLKLLNYLIDLQGFRLDVSENEIVLIAPL